MLRRQAHRDRVAELKRGIQPYRGQQHGTHGNRVAVHRAEKLAGAYLPWDPRHVLCVQADMLGPDHHHHRPGSSVSVRQVQLTQIGDNSPPICLQRARKQVLCAEEASYRQRGGALHRHNLGLLLAEAVHARYEHDDRWDDEQQRGRREQRGIAAARGGTHRSIILYMLSVGTVSGHGMFNHGTNL